MQKAAACRCAASVPSVGPARRCLTIAPLLKSEISRLQGQNAALKKELLARGLPLPGGMKPDAPKAKSGNGGTNSQDGVRLPSDAELNKMMTFVEKVWRRLIEMMTNAQRDILGKT